MVVCAILNLELAHGNLADRFGLPARPKPAGGLELCNQRPVITLADQLVDPCEHYVGLSFPFPRLFQGLAQCFELTRLRGGRLDLA